MANKRDTRGKRTSSEEEALRVVPRPKRRRLFPRFIVRLFLVAVLITAGMYIWKNWADMAPENALLWVNDRLAGEPRGSGFPLEITGSAVLDMRETQGGLAVLSETSLVVYNGRGGELLRRQHGFSSPLLRTAGKWLLVTDINGNRARLETRASTAVEITEDNRIISAAVSNNGSFALATDSSQGYTSVAAVYDRQGQQVYRWYSAELTILDVAISPNGKSMAVAGVMADHGAMRSSVLLFDFSKENPVAEYHDTDLMLFAVEYFPNGTLAAVGDRGIWVFNKSGSIQQKHGYDDRTLSGYVFGKSAVSAILGDMGGGDGGTLMTVNPSGDKAYSSSFEGAYRHAVSYDRGVLLLTSEKLLCADAEGTLFAADTVRDGRMLGMLGDKIMVLGLTSLQEVSAPDTPLSVSSSAT